MSGPDVVGPEVGWFYDWRGRTHYDAGAGRGVCGEAARNGLFGEQPIVGAMGSWKSHDDCGQCRRWVDERKADQDREAARVEREARHVPVVDADGWAE